MATLKQKGDLAELKVAVDLVAQGYRVLFPFGEDHDYDLVIDDGARFQRVQAKYTRESDGVIGARCQSHSLTNGKIRVTKQYTAATIDWLAVYDAASDRCFYLPATLLGAGRTELRLRVRPAKNQQRARIRWAEDFRDLATALETVRGLDSDAEGP